MKKIALVFALLMAFGVSLASAADYQVVISDVDGTGPYVGQNLDPVVAHALTVKINIINWNYGTDPIFASNAGFLISQPTKVNFVSAQYAPWGDPSFSGFVVNTPNASYTLTTSLFACQAVVTPFLVYTVQLTTVAGAAPGPVILSAKSGPDADFNINVGEGGCVSPKEYRDGGTGTATINLAPPPCTLTIAGCADQFDLAAEKTVQLTSSESGECSPTTPADISYSITCTGAGITNCADADISINAATGLITIAENKGALPVEVCATVVDAKNDAACQQIPAGSCTCCFDVEYRGLCSISIYEGGYPVPPLNTFSMPGRRGLALTCGDTVQFEYCEDCIVDTCAQWTTTVISGTPPAGTYISNAIGAFDRGTLYIGPDCTGLTAPAVIEVKVTDTCNANISDTVIVTVGEITIGVNDIFAASGAEGVVATVTLENKYHAVKGIQTEIKDTANYLTCTSCSPDPDRALEFICSAIEQADGDCKIVMVSTNPAGLIEEGTGAVATIAYDVNANAPANGCFSVGPTNSIIADRFGDQLCVCEESGEVCFIICGDIYPRECLPNLPNCGDGKVDIFDILEEIDFVLGYVIPSACQAPRADVPTGTPPYCEPPDQSIDILDVLVIIDMALGKANCCDYYYFGKIY